FRRAGRNDERCPGEVLHHRSLSEVPVDARANVKSPARRTSRSADWLMAASRTKRLGRCAPQLSIALKQAIWLRKQSEQFADERKSDDYKKISAQRNWSLDLVQLFLRLNDQPTKLCQLIGCQEKARAFKEAAFDGHQDAAIDLFDAHDFEITA